nr:alkaline phosphatase PhoX [Chroococcidiopsis sp. CCNUC1]
MSRITRRQLLVFFGAGVGAAAFSPVLENKLFGAGSNAAQAAEALSFTPVRLPHPLPIYQQLPSYLPAGSEKGQVLQPSTDARLTKYTVYDDVIVPPEYERYVIVGWGDRVFSNPDDYFGYNCDYTGFIPIKDSRVRNIIDGSSYDGIAVKDGYLWVNHEYVSYPISLLAPETQKIWQGSPNLSLI